MITPRVEYAETVSSSTPSTLWAPPKETHDRNAGSEINVAILTWKKHKTQGLFLPEAGQHRVSYARALKSPRNANNPESATIDQFLMPPPRSSKVPKPWLRARPLTRYPGPPQANKTISRSPGAPGLRPGPLWLRQGLAQAGAAARTDPKAKTLKPLKSRPHRVHLKAWVQQTNADTLKSSGLPA